MLSQIIEQHLLFIKLPTVNLSLCNDSIVCALFSFLVMKSFALRLD